MFIRSSRFFQITDNFSKRRRELKLFALLLLRRCLSGRTRLSLVSCVWSKTITFQQKTMWTAVSAAFKCLVLTLCGCFSFTLFVKECELFFTSCACTSLHLLSLTTSDLGLQFRVCLCNLSSYCYTSFHFFLLLCLTHKFFCLSLAYFAPFVLVLFFLCVRLFSSSSFPFRWPLGALCCTAVHGLESSSGQTGMCCAF
jgi:hypothetical protein